MNGPHASSLVLRLQEEALEKIDIYERLITKAVLNKVNSMSIGRHDTLSRQELQVVLHLVEGLSRSEIASAMKINFHTVSEYQMRIRQKLELSKTADIPRYAFKIALERSK